MLYEESSSPLVIESPYGDWRVTFKGIGGDPAKKKTIFVYVVALSFLFPKWGHMSLNYWNFLFYKHLHDDRITKYRENRTLQKKMAIF